MLTEDIRAIMDESKEQGWVLEPEAKRLLGLAGFDVPEFAWVRSAEEAVRFAHETGYPVVAKVVSPEALHTRVPGPGTSDRW